MSRKFNPADTFKKIGQALGEAGVALHEKAAPLTTAITTTVTQAATHAATSASQAANDIQHRVTDWLKQPATSASAAPLDAAAIAAHIEQAAQAAAPVIWLLGKTGAGKSSIIATLTGSTAAKVGNGYISCTRTAELFNFPADTPLTPLLRFLDTRGLGETDYDPTQDIAWHQAQSHLIVVAMKACDPSQEEVLKAVHQIRAQQPDWPVLVVQTGLHDLYEPSSNDHPAMYPFTNHHHPENNDTTEISNIPRALRNTLAYQRGLFSKIKGTQPLFVPVDFTPEEDGYTPADYGKAALIHAITDIAPESIRLTIQLQIAQEHSEQNNARMQELHTPILYWAAGAAAVGATPVVGLVTVPIAQAAMLRQLAKHYGVEWGMKDMSALSAMQGTAIVVTQGALWAVRQVAKIGPWLIPVAAAQDYALTYALGRAACVYLQARQDPTAAHAEQVKTAFKEGLKQAFMAREKPHTP